MIAVIRSGLWPASSEPGHPGRKAMSRSARRQRPKTVLGIKPTLFHRREIRGAWELTGGDTSYLVWAPANP